MRVTLQRLSQRVHTPLIHFIGKRQWPKEVGQQHPHPAAPPEFKNSFQDFLKKYESSSAHSSSSAASKSRKSSNSKDTGAYMEFWEAPPRLWNSRIKHLDDAEIEAVLSGGASLR